MKPVRLPQHVSDDSDKQVEGHPMISAEAMSRYRAAAAQRQAEQRQRIAERYQRAQQVAQEASDILKHEFGASKVVLFGSALQLSQFHAHSDVDLAVWGLDER